MENNQRLRLGVIDVLNVLPVFYGLMKNKIPHDCRIVRGKVTELNQKLNRGEIDISVVSSFEYALNPDEYYILPDLSVSADGPVKSIYLFLNKPIESLDGDLIKLTEFSLTSVHLIRYLLKDQNVKFTQEKTDKACGELLIADDAIKRFYRQEDKFVYDLSELWKGKTGLPFVFALWLVRRQVLKDNQTAVKNIYSALIASKNYAQETYSQMAEEKFYGVFPDSESCANYLMNLHYSFSAEYQAGFRLFQEKMVELNFLRKPAEINFAFSESLTGK